MRIEDTERYKTAIHEAGHVVCAYLMRKHFANVCLYSNVTGKAGETFLYKPKYDILTISKEDYSNPEIIQKVNEEARDSIFILLFGFCAESIYLEIPIDTKPDLRDGSDSEKCCKIFKKLCDYNNFVLDIPKFLTLYKNFIEIADKKIRNDKHLFQIIKKVAKKLYHNKKECLSFKDLKCTFYRALFWKCFFPNFQLKLTFDVDIIDEIKKVQ